VVAKSARTLGKVAEALFRALALKTSSSPRSFTFPCLTKPTTNTNLATKDNSLPIASCAARWYHMHFEWGFLYCAFSCVCSRLPGHSLIPNRLPKAHRSLSNHSRLLDHSPWCCCLDVFRFVWPALHTCSLGRVRITSKPVCLVFASFAGCLRVANLSLRPVRNHLPTKTTTLSRL
jgi:hypothetical protein